MGMKSLNTKDILMSNTGDTRGDGSFRRVLSGDIKKHSFPQRCTWNLLEKEVIQTKTVKKFQACVDKSNYGNGSVQAQVLSCLSKLDEYTIR